MSEVKDGYKLFFDEFIKERKQEFFEFGLNAIVEVDKKLAAQEWEDLKRRLYEDKTVFIRRYGRSDISRILFIEMNEYLFGNKNIENDRTNNANPRKLIEKLTGYAKITNSKSGLKPIQNFQISHVFGRTKNPLAFTAPWNIVYLPKIFDPFTGHEAKGDEVTEFTKLFQEKCINTFGDLIQDFNEIMNSDAVTSKLKSGIEYVATTKNLTEKQKQQFKKSVDSEFEPIQLED